MTISKIKYFLLIVFIVITPIHYTKINAIEGETASTITWSLITALLGAGTGGGVIYWLMSSPKKRFTTAD